MRFVLRDDDTEGRLIQSQGVKAIVYAFSLWNDTDALYAIMREDNLDSGIQKKKSEINVFYIHPIVSKHPLPDPESPTDESSTDGMHPLPDFQWFPERGWVKIGRTLCKLGDSV